MPVMRGKVTPKELVVEVEGRQHFMPKGCDPIIGPHLEKLAGKPIEVLMAKDMVLAVRSLEEDRARRIIITCYLCPPELVFREDILEKIAPIITQELVEARILDKTNLEEHTEFSIR